MTSPLNNLPTEAENTTLQKLFIAIFFNDFEKVIEFKNQYPEIYEKKGHFLIDDNTPFDLTNLTFLNQIIWNDDDWIEETLPLVKKNRQQAKQLMDYWNTELGTQNMQRVIEYNHYYEYFYCDDPNEAEDEEEVILEPISYYVEKGFRGIDIKLYARAECFDFVEVKKLLEQGANPDINFDNDDNSSAMSRIDGEYSYLATCHVVPEFQLFEEAAYNQEFNIKELFGNLLGLAAHDVMYHLLKKYAEY